MQAERTSGDYVRIRPGDGPELVEERQHILGHPSRKLFVALRGLFRPHEKVGRAQGYDKAG